MFLCVRISYTEANKSRRLADISSTSGFTWDFITLQRADIKQCVDVQTVEALQLRAPGVINADREFTIQAMQSGLLFPGLVDPSARRRIEQSLLNIKCLIPSIKSMHGNLTYLGEGAVLLKRLVAGDCKLGTLQSTLKEHWKIPETP